MRERDELADLEENGAREELADLEDLADLEALGGRQVRDTREGCEEREGFEGREEREDWADREDCADREDQEDQEDREDWADRENYGDREDRDGRACEDTAPSRSRRFHPLPLAAARIASFWTDVWKSWRLVFDWTVIVYLALPGIFVFANMYRDAWEHTPGWFELMRPQIVYALLGLLMLGARLRTFADPGDGLILRRNARWTGTLYAAGVAYTLAARLLMSASALVLLIPILTIRLHWSLEEGLFTAAASSLFGFVWALIRDGIERRRAGWGRIALLWFIRALLLASWVAFMTWTASTGDAARYAPHVLLLAASALLVWRRAKAKGTFLQEILAENEAYQACVQFLLKNSAGIRSMPKGRRPLLSFAGRRLFRERDVTRRIAELGVKAGLRESGNIRTLLQMTAAGAAALLLIPFGLGLFVWLALGALSLFWVHWQWGHWREERYVSMLPLSFESLQRAENVGRLVYCRPLFGLWGVILGVKAGLTYGSWGWLAVPVLLAVSWPLANYMNRAATRIWKRRSRRSAAKGADDSL
nr:ABC transporter permease [Cohnella lubricantis]